MYHITPGLRVLLAEDHVDTARITARLLRMRGHDVTVARTGLEAINAVKEADPDVILLDIGLPEMDGYEVANQLKELRPNKTPLIITVTGHGQPEDKQRAIEAGVDLFLVKPVDPELLEGVLSRFSRLLVE